MRVLFMVLERFPGSETRVQRQVLALLDRGHEVRVLAAGPRTGELTWEGAIVERCLTGRRKRSSTFRRLWEYIAFPAECFFRVVRISISWRPSIVQVANMPDWLVFSALPARIMGGSRVILDFHDLMPDLQEAKGGSRIGHAILLAAERLAVRVADSVLTVTPMCVANLVERNLGAEVSLVPNAVDESVFRVPVHVEKLGERGYHMGFHGTLAPRFGVDIGVRAVAELVHEGIDVRFHIWGDGESRRPLEHLARGLGVSDYVVFHGQVPSLELPSRLAALDLALVPYRNDMFMRLAYSTKAFEYAALSVPMIVSDIDSLRTQFVGAPVRFVASDDVDAWVCAIREVLRMPEAAAGNAERIRAKVSLEYSWSQWAVKYVDLVEAAGS